MTTITRLGPGKNLASGCRRCPKCERYAVGYGRLADRPDVYDYKRARCKRCRATFEVKG